MFSFFKKKTVPQWAACLKEKQYSAFIKALERHLKKWGIYSYRLSDDGGLAILWETSVGSLKNGLGLSLLAKTCAEIRIQDYDSVMTHSLDIFDRMQKLVCDLDSSVFDKAAKYIGVKIYSEDYFIAAGDRAVSRKIADGLYGFVVYDLPEVVTVINRQAAKSWGVSDDDLFRIGIENIRRSYPLKPVPREVDDFRCLVVSGEHSFAPNIVFEIEQHPELTGSYGALIGVPYRHGVFIYPFTDDEIISKIRNMVHLTATMYEDDSGASAISPRLYWYQDGLFTDIPYQRVDDGLNLFPPENFSDIIMRLQPPNAT